MGTIIGVVLLVPVILGCLVWVSIPFVALMRHNPDIVQIGYR